MVKYIHFHDQLNKSKVFGDFRLMNEKKPKDYTKFYDDEKYKFLMPDDFKKYKNKTVYIA